MRIDIWSDVVCPFCFLGKRRLDEALAGWEHQDQVEVVWHSFELDPSAPTEISGTLAENIATKYRTSLEQSEATQRAIAEQFSLVGGVFNWDIAKPGNTFDAHRVAHLAVAKGKGEQVMSALMKAYFADGLAIGDPEVVAQVAVGAGLETTEVQAVLQSDDYADAVREDESAAQQIGISGVPFFVFDERLAVSGAQPVEVFTQALTQAWDTRAKSFVKVEGAGTAEACGPEGC